MLCFHQQAVGLKYILANQNYAKAMSCSSSRLKNWWMWLDLWNLQKTLSHTGYEVDFVMSRIPKVQFKGTNSHQKTCEIFHVYCIFYSGFMCQTTVIFGIMKDESLVLNPLASWNCFTCRNLFQNGANNMSEWLSCETAFCKKSSKFCIVRIIRFGSNFASLW